MVNFEAQLSLEKKEIERNSTLYGTVEVPGHALEWENGFIDYGGLKKFLESLRCSADEQSKRGSFVKNLFTQSSELLASLKKGEWDEQEDAFAKRLDEEVEKVFLFYLAKQGELASRVLDLHVKAHTLRSTQHLDVCRANIEDGPSPPCNGSTIWGLRQQLLVSERDMVQLLQFLRLNVTGLRKILKKHDKQIRNNLLAKHYLTTRAENKYSSINQLIFSEGLLALIDSLKEASQRISLLEENTVHHLDNTEDKILAGSIEVNGSQLQSLNSENAHAKICDELALLQESRNRTITDYLHLTAGDMLLEPGMDITDMTDEEAHKVLVKLKLDAMSAYLNLAYTFLYMNNYYIVAPSATHWAEMLGINKSISGLIIGMTPIASCLSMVLYSIWTNMCFKSPLLLCSVLLVMGNLLCAGAVQHSSFVMLLVGRLLVGLGGPRAINRRYIADTVPLGKRTFFSVSFVAAGTLGMATGPAIAGSLENFYLPMGPLGIVDELSAPAWLMLFLWVGLGLLTAVWFNEPEERLSPGSEKRFNEMKAHKDVSTPKTRGIIISAGENNDGKEERAHLLGPVANSLMIGPDDEKSSLQDILILTFCLSAYGVNKFVAEAVVCSASIVTQFFFNWSLANVGSFMAVLGLSTLPLIVVIGVLSTIMRDSVLMCGSAFFSAISCAILVNGVGAYTDARYMIGAIGLFLSVQAHEAVTMSITSKIIPPNLARGTFNSGFLATEIGTASRFIGDLLIAMTGLVPVNCIANAVFIPCFVLFTLLSITSVILRPYFDV